MQQFVVYNPTPTLQQVLASSPSMQQLVVYNPSPACSSVAYSPIKKQFVEYSPSQQKFVVYSSFSAANPAEAIMTTRLTLGLWQGGGQVRTRTTSPSSTKSSRM